MAQPLLPQRSQRHRRQRGGNATLSFQQRFNNSHFCHQRAFKSVLDAECEEKERRNTWKTRTQKALAAVSSCGDSSAKKIHTARTVHSLKWPRFILTERLRRLLQRRRKSFTRSREAERPHLHPVTPPSTAPPTNTCKQLPSQIGSCNIIPPITAE